MKYTVIIPSRGLDGKYLKLALLTYEKYLQDVYEIIIITPDTSLQNYIKDMNYKHNYKILNDDLFYFDTQNNKWYNQQFIKLLISIYVSTDLYFILDDDIFLIKPITYNDIYVDTRIRYSSESYNTLSTPNYSSLDWWLGSCKLLNLIPTCIINDNLMNVTPQIFITEHVLNLVDWLYKNYDDWFDEFITNKCSEYSLYWLWLYKNNLQNLYTNNCKHWWYTNIFTNILETQTNLWDFINTCKNGFDTNINLGYCMVIQSHLNYPNYIVSDILSKINYIN
jgi:hypothetical protein